MDVCCTSWSRASQAKPPRSSSSFSLSPSRPRAACSLHACMSASVGALRLAHAAHESRISDLRGGARERRRAGIEPRDVGGSRVRAWRILVRAVSRVRGLGDERNVRRKIRQCHGGGLCLARTPAFGCSHALAGGDRGGALGGGRRRGEQPFDLFDIYFLSISSLLSLLRFLLRRAASMKLCARWHGGGGARHKGSGVHVTRMETVKQAESREGKEAEEELR
jgi:hypothetical protein